MKKILIVLALIMCFIYFEREHTPPSTTIEVYDEKDSLIGVYPHAKIIHYAWNGRYDKAIKTYDSIDKHTNNIIFPSYYKLIEK